MSNRSLPSCHGFRGYTHTQSWFDTRGRTVYTHPGEGQGTVAAAGAAAAGRPHALPASAEPSLWPGAAAAAAAVASVHVASVGAKLPGVLSASGLPHPSWPPASAVPAAPHTGSGIWWLPWLNGPPGTKGIDALNQRGWTLRALPSFSSQGKCRRQGGLLNTLRQVTPNYP